MPESFRSNHVSYTIHHTLQGEAPTPYDWSRRWTGYAVFWYTPWLVQYSPCLAQGVCEGRGKGWFIKSQIRPLHANEEDETRRQGSNSPWPPRRTVLSYVTTRPQTALLQRQAAGVVLSSAAFSSGLLPATAAPWDFQKKAVRPTLPYPTLPYPAMPCPALP